MEFLADIYLFAGFICSLLGLKSLAKRLKRKSDALLETIQAELDQVRRDQEARIDQARREEEAKREESLKQYAASRKVLEEAKRLERQKCFNDPERNTQDWDLHQERLRKCKASRYDGCSYYVGPRGGVYYINYRGRKTYC